MSRGRLSAYRLSYRTAADSTVASVEIPQNSTQYLLEGLQPDTIYLLRMAAATRAGWCEPSAWTSHRTPKTSSSNGKGPEGSLPSFRLPLSMQTTRFYVGLEPFFKEQPWLSGSRGPGPKPRLLEPCFYCYVSNTGRITGAHADWPELALVALSHSLCVGYPGTFALGCQRCWSGLSHGS